MEDNTVYFVVDLKSDEVMYVKINFPFLILLKTLNIRLVSITDFFECTSKSGLSFDLLTSFTIFKSRMKILRLQYFKIKPLKWTIRIELKFSYFNWNFFTETGRFEKLLISATIINQKKIAAKERAKQGRETVKQGKKKKKKTGEGNRGKKRRKKTIGLSREAEERMKEGLLRSREAKNCVNTLGSKMSSTPGNVVTCIYN